MKRYTANELEAIRKLSEAIADDDQEQSISDSDTEDQDQLEEGLGFSADDFLSALQGGEPEESIEKRLEASYIQRAQTGQGLFKIHGKTIPTRIFW
jgi:hypothetical protein